MIRSFVKSRYQFPALIISAVISLTSCGADDSASMGDRIGYIRPVASLDASVIEDVSSRSADGEVTAGDLQLTLVSDKIDWTYGSVAEFDTEEEFEPGSYTMTAFYGNPDSEGFELPYYFGEASFNVAVGEVSEVDITATLANTMVSVETTEEFRAYFKSYTTILHSSGGAYVEVGAGETRAVYLRPGKVDITAQVALNSGAEARLQVGEFLALSRHHYIVTLDVKSAPGGAELVVEFDDKLDLEPVSVLLSEDLMNAPAPEISIDGAVEGEPLRLVTTSRPESDVIFNVIAPGGLRSLTLTTSAPQLVGDGWPAEVNLLSPSAREKALMESMGLRMPGTDMPDPRYASVVLTDLIPNLRDRSVRFTLNAVDRMGKTTSPRSVDVELEALVLDVRSVEPTGLLDEECSFMLASNSDTDPADFAYKVTDGSGSWIDAPLISVAPADGEGLYKVTVEVPALVYEFGLSVHASVAQSEEVRVTRVLPRFSITAPEGSVWATHASVALSADGDTEAGILAGLATVYVAEGDSGNFVETDAVADGGHIGFGDLSSATRYRVKVSLVGDPAVACEPVSFVTETMAGVPNGDFEQLTKTIEMNLQQGGNWTMTLGGKHFKTFMDMSVSEPQGWASTNAKTCYPEAATANSWYQIPSVYNSTLSWVSHQPTAKILGIGQSAYDEYPAVYQNIPVASGANAMVVRNVAWDANGRSIPVMSQTGNTSYSNYYCANIPEIANRSAGKLFLGTYAFDGVSETMVEGVSFSSRPSELTGSYMYEPDSQDPSEAGVVTVEILSGDAVIGSGSVELAEASSYTAFSVPVVYAVRNRRATSLRIMITSSNHTEEADIKTTNYCGKPECSSRGAALTIDNLKFTY